MNFEEEEQKQKPVKKIEHDPDALEAYLNQAEEPPKPVQPVQQPKVEEPPKPVTPPVEEPKAVTPPVETPKAEEPKPQTSTPPFETPKAETPQPQKPQLPVKYEQQAPVVINRLGLKIAIVSVVSLLIAGGGYYAYTHYYQKSVSKPVEVKKTEAVKPAPAPEVKATTPPQVITPPVIETPKAEQKVMVPPPPPSVVSAPSIDKPVKAEAVEHKTVDKPVKKSKPVHQEKDAWNDRVNQVEQFLKDK